MHIKTLYKKKHQTLRGFAGLCCLLFYTVTGVSAQSSNMEILQALAVGCLGEITSEYNTLIIDSPDHLPYIRPVLTNHWRNNGFTVSVSDPQQENSSGEAARLAYHFENAEVTYTRESGRQIVRNISLTTQYVLTSPGGQILAEDRCTEVYNDTILREDISRIESVEYPETRAPIPLQSTVRQVVEPVVLASVITVITYLFFTVRSRGNG